MHHVVTLADAKQRCIEENLGHLNPPCNLFFDECGNGNSFWFCPTWMYSQSAIIPSNCSSIMYIKPIPIEGISK